MNSRRAAKPQPKNVITILSDQHRWDAMEMYDARVHTPNLHRMADSGIMFNHNYCVTQACVPSRASFMTGKYQGEHLLRDNHKVLQRHEKTWPGYLSEHGVPTVAVGRTHHIDLGFDSVVRVPSGNSFPMDCHHKTLQKHWSSEAYVGPSPEPFEEYYEHKITQTALDFLQEISRSGMPFALYVGYLAPHAALTPPEPYWSMYKDLEVQMPEEGNVPVVIQEQIKAHGFDQVTPELYQKIVRGYFAMISMMDACIGMLLDKVEEMGLSENTVIIYTSDHGEMLGSKGLHSKCYGYDPSIRIPLIATCPGVIPAGRRTDAMIENIDIAPTVCDALGIETMPCSGRSAWNIMTGDKDQHREWIFSAMGNSMQTFRNHQWKWIRYADCHRNELYDMLNDPLEQNDISDTVEGRELIQKLCLKLLDFNITVHKAQVTDFDQDAVQPRLIPFFTT